MTEQYEELRCVVEGCDRAYWGPLGDVVVCSKHVKVFYEIARRKRAQAVKLAIKKLKHLRD